MESHLSVQSRFSALRPTILVVAFISCSTSLRGQPIPLEPGWSVRLLAGGLGRLGGGLAYDPVSTDLFVTGLVEAPGPTLDNRVYRITQFGEVTTIHSALIFEDNRQFSYLSFDPISRIVYFNPGDATFPPRPLRKIDEFGAFIEDVPSSGGYVMFTGMSFAPDGKLYLNGKRIGQIGYGIARYNDDDDTFATVHPAVGFSMNYGLSFDPPGNAYVAGGSGFFQVDTSGTITELSGLSYIGSTFGDGSGFASDGGGGSIWRVASDGSGRSQFATGHISAKELFFADNGRLYVIDRGQAIWEYSYIPEPTTRLFWILIAWLVQRRELRKLCRSNVGS